VKLAYDRYYARHFGPAIDLKIAVRTVVRLLRSKLRTVKSCPRGTKPNQCAAERHSSYSDEHAEIQE